ncbi:phosphotransferase [Gimibacter soli]|uniref:Phosphotransferase n=1 Tax=Gimibacter soli TaxID=3024400 RepID=A0AAE9XQ73_9PROT|nr:phosphotransferase [Gimibacter soli]WCL53076.1 phosphotransferase [Gimibacter soli]
MTKVALIPAAKLAPLELQVEFGSMPAAMLPVGGRPAFDYIARLYLDRGYRILVGIHEGGDRIRAYADLMGYDGVDLIDVGETASLGETIAVLMEQVPDDVSDMIVAFSDTLLTDNPDAPNLCFVDRVADPFRWTQLASDADGRIVKVTEKFEDSAWHGDALAFCGVFRIGDVHGFFRHLADELRLPAGQALDPFYRAFIAWFNAQPAASRALVQPKDWYDFGHLDTYYATRRRLGFGAREFNDVALDETRGILVKSSANADKFRREIAWYRDLPADLQFLAPRIFDADMGAERPSVAMEYYSYPALNDLYLFGDVAPAFWQRVIHALDKTLVLMGKRRPDLSDAEMAADLTEMYLGKTLERLDGLGDLSRFGAMAGERVTINGIVCPGLARVRRELAAVAEANDLLIAAYFSIIHGDFCLSNILFDPRHGIVRLIDPRGSFGRQSLTGDPRYDLAKLCHSIEGDYDHIIAGLYRFEMDGDQVTFTPAISRSQKVVKDLFTGWLARFPDDYMRQVRLIEALLFLSMLPLHGDRPEAQKALLARGLLLAGPYFS